MLLFLSRIMDKGENDAANSGTCGIVIPLTAAGLPTEASYARGASRGQGTLPGVPRIKGKESVCERYR